MMTRILSLLVVLMILCAGVVKAASGEDDKDEYKGTSGLQVPRFAALRSGEVNMRTGPGTRYPIEWVMTHQGLPVEIIAEYEIWRRIRDPEGAEGWVHKVSLTGKRSAMVIGAAQDLRRDHDPQSAIVAHLEKGAVGQLVSCNKDWCKLKFNGIKGYLPKTAFWGAYPNEVFD